MLLDLYAPVCELEDGTIERVPGEGILSLDQFMLLAQLPDGDA
jgi:hypothetical protein